MIRFRYKALKKWSPTAAARRSRARIQDVQAALVDLIGIWADRNETICGRVASIMDEVEDLSDEINDEVELQLDAWMVAP